VECIPRIPYTLHEIVTGGVGRDGTAVKIVKGEIKNLEFNAVSSVYCH
jgi:hypothetical protein